MSDNIVVTTQGTITLYWQGASIALIGSKEISARFGGWLLASGFCRDIQKLATENFRYCLVTNNTVIPVENGLLLRCGIPLTTAYELYLAEALPKSNLT